MDGIGTKSVPRTDGEPPDGTWIFPSGGLPHGLSADGFLPTLGHTEATRGPSSSLIQRWQPQSGSFSPQLKGATWERRGADLVSLCC